LRAGFRLARGDPAAGAPPPALGTHTDAIFGELEYTTENIEALRRERTI
jgi:crotonobetainyl-CoA:carnitine CoA-transferase CaiB-like acyl-CoA transferase